MNNNFYNFILNFGISLVDIYEIETMSNFFNKILDIFSNFHRSLLELFGKPMEVPNNLPTKMGSVNGIDPSSTTNQENSKIFERFNKIISKTEEIPEIPENVPFYKDGKTYIYIGGILILLSLSWYFYDDLKPIGTSILTWINPIRSRPDPGSNNSDGNIQGNTFSNNQSLKNKLYKKIWGDNDKGDPFIDLKSDNTSPSIKLEQHLTEDTKGKSIDFNNLTQSEIERRGILQQPLTGLENITGNSFELESISLLKEINTYLNYKENSSFPKATIQLGLYNFLRQKLYDLSQTDQLKYNSWIQDNLINEKIKDFINLDIVDIVLIDKNFKLHKIYYNPTVNYLKSFHENIGKSTNIL
jgi:hypothetical protein